MLILLFFMLILVLVGSVLTSREIHKIKKEHNHNIELLHNRVVEMTGKQLDLSVKMHLVNDFKNSSHSNFEKLNKEIFEFCDLLMKTSETQSPHNK